MDDTWYPGPTIISSQNKTNLDPDGPIVGSSGSYFGPKLAICVSFVIRSGKAKKKDTDIENKSSPRQTFRTGQDKKNWKKIRPIERAQETFFGSKIGP